MPSINRIRVNNVKYNLERSTTMILPCGCMERTLCTIWQMVVERVC